MIVNSSIVMSSTLYANMLFGKQKVHGLTAGNRLEHCVVSGLVCVFYWLR